MTRTVDTKTPVVWINYNEGDSCAGCGAKLARGCFIQINRESGIRCMKCAGYDDLVFLPAGNTALTRRAVAKSARHVIVVIFARARKRNERQGVLVEENALKEARESCAQDEASRAEARGKRRVRDQAADEDYKTRFTDEILRLYPGCPRGEAAEIAQHACAKYSGRVGRSAAAKAFIPRTIELAVRAHIRHRHTKYDDLFTEGLVVTEARREVRGEIDRIAHSWAKPPCGPVQQGPPAPCYFSP